MKTFAEHLDDFRHHQRLRAELVERWPRTAPLDPAVVASIQRFQLGEDGDGASLLAQSARAGDPVYAAAVLLFEQEEQNHARQLRNVLACAGAATITRHWSDTAFVRIRRALGLRLELMTLMLAEVVALRYYRALRDGTTNPVLTQTTARILADEERHVPFHVDRLRHGFSGTPSAGRLAAKSFWWLLMTGATLVVTADHGTALVILGVSRRRFVRDVLALFRPIAREVFTPLPPGAEGQIAGRSGRWRANHTSKSAAGIGRAWNQP